MKRIVIIMGALGVGIGAFGAHALQPLIETTGRQATWDTAIFYYWIHIIALLAMVFSTTDDADIRQNIRRTGVIWLFSILLFSGSLFALALGAPNGFGAITPLGGLGFITGWGLLLFPKKQKKAPRTSPEAL